MHSIHLYETAAACITNAFPYLIALFKQSVVCAAANLQVSACAVIEDQPLVLKDGPVAGTGLAGPAGHAGSCRAPDGLPLLP